MRDRLIGLIKSAEETFPKDKPVLDIEEFVADFLLANGVIAPPCSINDTIWYIDKDYNIRDAEVTCIYIRGTNYHVIATRYIYETEETVKLYLFFSDLNIRFWLTKEEDEEALRGIQKDE